MAQICLAILFLLSHPNCEQDSFWIWMAAAVITITTVIKDFVSCVFFGVIQIVRTYQFVADRNNILQNDHCNRTKKKSWNKKKIVPTSSTQELWKKVFFFQWKIREKKTFFHNSTQLPQLPFDLFCIFIFPPDLPMKVCLVCQEQLQLSLFETLGQKYSWERTVVNFWERKKRKKEFLTLLPLRFVSPGKRKRMRLIIKKKNKNEILKTNWSWLVNNVISKKRIELRTIKKNKNLSLLFCSCQLKREKQTRRVSFSMEEGFEGKHHQLVFSDRVQMLESKKF